MTDVKNKNMQALDAVVAELHRLTLGRENAHLTIDSREVGEGDIFIALRGLHSDGMTFAPKAVAAGCVAVLTEPRDDTDEETRELELGVPVITVEDLADKVGFLAAAYYGEPSQHMRGVAITGTNGKTTTSHWVSALLSRMHHPCAAIGTIGCFFMGEKFPSPPLTTPDAVSTQSLLADLYETGCQGFAIEASSIGLEQGRLAGCAFETAVFTNLTRDHLDYHGSMQAYEEAKEILFDWKSLKSAVINADDEAGRRFIDHAIDRGLRVIAYTLDKDLVIEGADMLSVSNVAADTQGMRFDAHWKGVAYGVKSHVLGDFNVSNLLATAGAALSLGIDAAPVFERICELVAPMGRLQPVIVENAPLAVVDYAHTPDALEKAIDALRAVTEVRGGKMHVIFGAGGDRDHGKRPIMGKIAAQMADAVVVTSDNPRTEKPEDIASAIVAGAEEILGKGKCRLILDRREAICETAAGAAREDVILIAGKGHETYQEVNGIRHHFSDQEEVFAALNARSAGKKTEQKSA